MPCMQENLQLSQFSFNSTNFLIQTISWLKLRDWLILKRIYFSQNQISQLCKRPVVFYRTVLSRYVESVFAFTRKLYP